MKLTVYIEAPCICQHRSELEIDAAEIADLSQEELSKLVADQAREAFFEECSYSFELVDDDGNEVDVDYINPDTIG